MTTTATTWLLEFYHGKRGILARFSVEASLPSAAALLGRQAVLAKYASARARGRPSLFEQAQRSDGDDGSGWVLYRIMKAA